MICKRNVKKDNAIINVALRQTERVFDPYSSKFGVDYEKFVADYEVNFLYDGGPMESIWVLSLPITSIFNTGRRPKMTHLFPVIGIKQVNDPCKKCVQNNAQNNDNNSAIEWDILPCREKWHIWQP